MEDQELNNSLAFEQRVLQISEMANISPTEFKIRMRDDYLTLLKMRAEGYTIVAIKHGMTEGNYKVLL